MKYSLECAVWEFTLKCNLNCIHCGSSAGKKRENELNTNEAISLCYQLKNAGCLSVALMGGEPFLRKDFWQVAKKIRQLQMELSVITNGTIFDYSVFKRLRELSPTAVAVSIDGAKKETHEKIRGVKGCYEKSWEFINLALAEKLPVSIITTVSKLNIAELGEMANQIRNRQIAWQIQTAGAEGKRFSDKFLLNRNEFYSVGIFIENLRRKYKPLEMPVIGAHDLGYNSYFLKNTSIQPVWKGCQAGKTVIGIRSNGDIIGCLSINNDKFIEGNIREKSLKEIWESENSFKYTRKFNLNEAGKYCRDCLYLADCRGGCCEMSLMKTGILHNDYYCFFKIEDEIIKEENILSKILWKLRKKSSKEKNTFSRIKKIFLGERKI